MSSSMSFALCACGNLKRASRAISHLYDLVLAPTGLRVSQFLLLWAITDTGSSAHCDLARRFAASEETFSRRLASARKAGWVQMSIDPRRRRIYSLTEAGQAVLQSGIPYWERAQERMRRQLGETDWNLLTAFAERVTAAAIAAEKAPLKNSSPALHTDYAPWALDNQARRFPAPERAADSQ